MKTLHPGQTEGLVKHCEGGKNILSILRKGSRECPKALLCWQSTQLQLCCSHVCNPRASPCTFGCCWSLLLAQVGSQSCSHKAQGAAPGGVFLLKMVFGPQKPSPSSLLSPTNHPFDYFLKQSSSFIASK